MCSAVGASLASLALSTTGALVSAAGQRKQLEAEAEYQQAVAQEHARVAAMNAAAAGHDFTEQSAAERMGQMQEQQAAAQQAQEVQKEALQKRGTMLASTQAAGGVLNALLADYNREEAVRRDTIRHQYTMNAAGSDAAVRAHRDRAQNRLNTQERYIASGSPPDSGLSALGTALQIGSGGLDAYDRYKRYDQKTKA